MKRVLSRLLYVFGLAILVLTSKASHAQIKASGAGPQKEFASPMELEIPIPEGFIENRNRPWRTTELKDYICNEVSIEELVTTWRAVQGRKDTTQVEMSFQVTTYTRPPQDMEATFTFWLKNDDEELRLTDKNGRQARAMVVDAEETKTEKESTTHYTPADKFQRIMHGPNPRLVIKVTSREN